MRLGFLGTGWIGRHRMEAMLATGAVTAAAVCEPGEAALADAVKLAPDTVVAPSLDAMLAMGLDGVVIATPSALHADQSIAALQAGCAVFCQKPLGRDAGEVARVVEAARAADRLLGVDLSYRYTAATRAVRDLLAERALGRVFAADLVFHNAYGPDKPWFYDRAQSGGGCLIDLGVHLVDQVLWLLGFPDVTDLTASLRAGGEPLAPGQVEDYATVAFHAGDVDVRLACSWRLNAGQEAEIGLRLYGTGGGAILRNVGGSFYDFAVDHATGTAHQTLVTPPDDWGGRAAADWARRLAAGARYDAAAADFIRSAEVLDRAYAAQFTG